MSWEKPQASKEEISACEIFHPSSNSSPNEILVVNGLDDEKCFMGNKSDGLDSEALVHIFDLEFENYVHITSLSTDGT